MVTIVVSIVLGLAIWTALRIALVEALRWYLARPKQTTFHAPRRRYYHPLHWVSTKIVEGIVPNKVGQP